MLAKPFTAAVRWRRYPNMSVKFESPRPMSLVEAQDRMHSGQSRSRGELGKKLSITFTALAAVMGLMCAAALWSTSRLGGALNRSAHQTVPSQQALGALLASVKDMKASAYAAQVAIVIGYMEKGSKLEGSCTACHDAAMIEKHNKAFAAHGRDARQQLATLRSLASDKQFQNIQTIETALATWDGLESDYTRKASAGEFDAAHEVLANGIDPLLVKLGSTAAALSMGGDQELAESAASGESIVKVARWLALALCLLSAPVALFGVRTLLISTANLRQCGGNLTQVIRQLMDSASQMASSSQSLAAGVEQQGACLKDTARRGLAVREQAAANAASAKEAAERVELAAASTAEASAVLAEMAVAMQAIDTTSQKVAGILKVMDEIASQTNLLALNASVEAARAGHAGLGLAVVAEEVRSLAQRSATAARETAELVNASRSKSADGRRLSDKVRQVVEVISAQTAEIQDRVRLVTASSQQQARDMESVKSSIEELERLAAQNEQIAQTTAAGAAEVARGGQGLGAVVEQVERMAGV
jgi:methyl-accepting chemotaxis protein/methyl-accepting chemotaxis protein-1 (serine sensor receptor)